MDNIKMINKKRIKYYLLIFIIFLTSCTKNALVDNIPNTLGIIKLGNFENYKLFNIYITSNGAQGDFIPNIYTIISNKPIYGLIVTNIDTNIYNYNLKIINLNAGNPSYSMGGKSIYTWFMINNSDTSNLKLTLYRNNIYSTFYKW